MPLTTENAVIGAKALLIRAALVLTWFLFAFGSAPAVAEDTRFSKNWVGSFQCTSGSPFSVSLELETASSGLMTGTVLLRGESSGAVFAQFNVRARLAQSNDLIAFPSEWVVRPDGVRLQTFEIKMRSSGYEIEVDFPFCDQESDGLTVLVAEGLSSDDERNRYVGGLPPRITEWEGDWTGHATCKEGQAKIPVKLTLVEDYPGVAALLTVSPPWREAMTSVLTGMAESPDSLNLNRQIQPRSIGANYYPPDGVTGIRGGSGELRIQISNMVWSQSQGQCDEALLTRKGPPSIPLVGDPGLWSGVYAGYRYVPYQRKGVTYGALVQLRRSEVSARYFHFSNDGDVPYLVFSATNDPLAEPNARSRMTALLRPLFRTPEGDLAYVLVNHRTGNGRYDLTEANRFGSSLAMGRRPFIVLAAENDDDSLQVFVRQSVAPTRDNFSYPAYPITVQQEEALRAGAMPTFRLAPTLEGAISDSDSFENQCLLVADWITERSLKEASVKMRSAALHKAMLPALVDHAFVPLFGLPFTFLQAEERHYIADLMENCARRLGQDDLRAANQPQIKALAGKIASALGDRGFDYVVANLLNVAETNSWSDDALEKIAAMKATDSDTLVELSRIENEMESRREELVPTAAENLSVAILAKNQSVFDATLLSDFEALSALPVNAGILPKLVSIVRRYPQAGKSYDADGNQWADLGRITKEIERQELAELPDIQLDTIQPTLNGLEALNDRERELKALMARLPLALGGRDVTAALERNQALRIQLMDKSAVQAEMIALLDQRADIFETPSQLLAFIGSYDATGHLARQLDLSKYEQIIAEKNREKEIEATGYSGPPTIEERRLGPSAKSIRLALTRELAGKYNVLDSMGAACRNTGEVMNAQNYIGALSCVMTLGGAINSETVGFSVNRVTVQKCNAVEGNQFLCEYKASASGNRRTHPIVDFMVTIGTLGGSKYATFGHDNKGWYVNKVYDDCTYDAAVGIHNCRRTVRY